MYSVGPGFVSLATSSAHVDGVRVISMTEADSGFRDGREGELVCS